MRVYCEACDQVEHLTPLEAEKVIYVLEAEQRFDPGRDDGTTKPVRFETPMCIWGALAMASDSECYAGHVEASIERRKAAPADSNTAAQDGVQK